VWHFFHLVSPVGLIANLVVVPLSSLALSAEFGSLVCSPVFPWLGEVFNASAWVWMKLMILAGRWSASVPGGHVWVASPDWYWWIPWYLGLVGAAFGAFRVAVGRWLGITGLTVWIASAGWRWWEVRSELQVTVFDQGEALGISAARGSSVMLIDAGSRTDALRTLIPWAHSQGVGRLPWMVMSRSDRRHTSGLPEILRELDPSVWVAFDGWRRPVELSGWAPPTGTQVRIVFSGDQVNGWLAWNSGRGNTRMLASELNLPLFLERNGIHLLWLPGLGPRAQETLASESRVPVDLLIATVPSRGEMVSDTLLERLRPRVLVLASESPPSPRRVSANEVQRFRKRGVIVWRTDRMGAVTIRLKPDRLELHSMSGFDLSLPRSDPSADVSALHARVP
jgi:competence protein ComEC